MQIKNFPFTSERIDVIDLVLPKRKIFDFKPLNQRQKRRNARRTGNFKKR